LHHMSSPSTVSNVARCAGKPGSEYIFPPGAPSPPLLTCVTPRSLADKRPQSSRGKRVEAIRSRDATGKSRSKVCSAPYFRTPISDPLCLEAIRGRDATGESRSKVHSDPNFELRQRCRVRRGGSANDHHGFSSDTARHSSFWCCDAMTNSSANERANHTERVCDGVTARSPRTSEIAIRETGGDPLRPLFQKGTLLSECAKRRCDAEYGTPPFRPRHCPTLPWCH